MGGQELARDIYAAAALQVASRRKILRGLRSGRAWSDNLRDHSLKTASAEKPVAEKTVNTETTPSVATTEIPAVNKNYRGAGDYFSREQYERVKEDAEKTATPAGDASNANSFNLDRDISLDGFHTEALAEIYAEQGYFERAKEIYAKLILAYPEKNTYFASLIEKLN
ncbi:MAG: hypothetical protein LUD72_05985, partial [Bacteroidales bacterium]|nr:hypothetical protein [Bacteroidales bacterium]